MKRLFRFIAGNKAQFFYAFLVLIFNVVAIYYLFFYSNSQINLAQFLPSKEVFVTAIETPFQEIMKKFVYVRPTPTPSIPTTATPTPYGSTPTNIPQPTPELIDCIGPDGQHSWLSQKDCDTFNAAWKGSPTPSPIASPSAAVN